ncbi:MAG: hypothetical protein KC996_04720 [Phycisphaerales bacterium]|nr:hypothetical protein [Phycisphaerales bacterium]
MKKKSLIAYFALPLLLGCASSPQTLPRTTTTSSSIKRMIVHDDTRGERVLVNLITPAEWNSRYKDGLIENKSIVLPDPPPLELVSNDDEFRSLDSIAGAVIGTAVDFIQGQIKKEAAKHERQFHGMTYATDFWVDATPKYVAFEIVRFTDQHPEVPASGNNELRPLKDAAYRLICAFQYSEYDPRICTIKPVYLKINSAKAKVTKQGGKYRIESKADVFLSGSWISSTDAFVTQDLAEAGFKQGSYDLEKSQAMYATWNSSKSTWSGEGGLDKLTYGYFRTPPVSGDRWKAAEVQYKSTLREIGTSNSTDSINRRSRAKEQLIAAYSGGAFKLSVVVTETDKSRAKETLIKIADYIGEQKESIIKAVEK